MTRRKTIALAVSLVTTNYFGKFAHALVQNETGLSTLSHRPLHELTVTEVLSLFAAGRVSPLEYVDELLQWQTRWKNLNAFISQDLAYTRDAASRLGAHSLESASLAGIPIVAKDNIDIAGFVTTAGTPALRNWRPPVSAPMVSELLNHGALIMGKVGLHELAAGGTCANLTFGQIHNPYDLGRIPGGSSGGTAAAVAACLAPAGLGTDTGGSNRLPAALCGCVGYRPSAGRYDPRGVVPRNARRDTIGWMARNVTDITLLDACSGVPAAPPLRSLGLKGLRIGIPRSHFYADLDAEIGRIVEGTLQCLRAAGVEFIEADIPDLERHQGQPSAQSPWADFVDDLDRYLTGNRVGIPVEEFVRAVADPQLRAALERGLAERDGPRTSFEVLERAELEFRAAYANYFNTRRVEAVIIPTSPILAPEIPQEPEKGGTGPAAMVRNTGPSAQAGLPGISIPVGMTRQGLPVGMEVDGPFGADTTLFDIARLLESVLPQLLPPTPLGQKSI